jgi:hypothetical protein
VEEVRLLSGHIQAVSARNDVLEAQMRRMEERLTEQQEQIRKNQEELMKKITPPPSSPGFLATVFGFILRPCRSKKS